MTSTYHEPVMVEEVLAHLLTKPREVVVDCTLGDGGHSLAILDSTKGTFVVGLDVDEEAISRAQTRLEVRHPGRFAVTKGDYRDLPFVLGRLGIPAVDGTLHDLGVSSLQLDDPERGFSYRGDGPLDMRMGKDLGISAKDLLNSLGEDELKTILWDYGEERYAARIARGIVAARANRPLDTCDDLVEVIRRSIPPSARRGKTHPARRTFQAIRIAVNDELARLGPSIEAAFGMVKAGGLSIVISYHSLEDRIVKRTMRHLETLGCAKRLSKRPQTPKEAEVSANPRARSAKLRAVEKVGR